MLLEVKDLKVEFNNKAGKTEAVRGISFDMEEGEILGIVGESGSGKSTAALCLMGLLPGSASYSGSVVFEGEELINAGFDELTRIKGSKISMIFQEALSSLNPLIRVGKQVEEMLRLHPDAEKPLSKEERRAKVLEMFSFVDLPNPEGIYKKYPHELSGGMQQRVMIAMALICSPKLLIADEPTTALDAKIQDQILDLISDINKKTGTAIIFVSHDLRVIRRICSRVMVMYEGKIIERGPVSEIFENPQQDYTKKLIAAISDERKEETQLDTEAVLTVKDLSVFYKIKSRKMSEKAQLKYVCKNMSFEVRKGEILGLVGKSGIGKSSISRAVLGLHKDYTGEIILNEENPQMVFQDSASSLNPAKKVGWILQEPLKNMTSLSKEERMEKIYEMLELVELPKEYAKRYPRQLSGGQKQRVNIALALISGSKFIIADEPVSALDVTIQEQILSLLLKLQKELGLSMIFISHDIAVVNRICDRVIEFPESVN